MKKRISLTQQLFLIYTFVLVITTITFYSILSTWLFDIYTDINYTKLDDFALNAKTIIDNGYNISYLEETSNVEFIIWNENEHHYSDGLFNIMDEDYLNSIYKDIENVLIEEDVYRGKLEDGLYFYSAIKTDDSEYYIFTVSSGFLITEMRNDTGSQIMILFLMILIGGGLIIAIWSNLVVKRIAKISKHVLYMPKTNYGSPYIDDYPDEIGSLANSIESMRIQIYENEETKKEIIQNLSHDFKTPLAVIKSYAEAIVDGIEDPESGQLIIKQADILQHKVEKLLQLNRLNYLEEDRVFEEVNMKKIITKIVDNLKYLSNLKFELSLDDSIFYGYEENYITVVENVLSNAMRYANTKIVITLEDNVLKFYNDGKHIEEKFIDANFKAYEKGSEGLFGVGMSIVKQTVDFFKLELSVQNEDIGVTFIIKNK